eukprot:COSAG03_NODE_23070_length_283_cov_1.603261_1_plen_32_part_01
MPSLRGAAILLLQPLLVCRAELPPVPSTAEPS